MSVYEWISNSECWEAPEVSIDRPQIPYTVKKADRGHASVMNLRSCDAPLLKGRAKFLPVSFGFR